MIEVSVSIQKVVVVAVLLQNEVRELLWLRQSRNFWDAFSFLYTETNLAD